MNPPIVRYTVGGFWFAWLAVGPRDASCWCGAQVRDAGATPRAYPPRRRTASIRTSLWGPRVARP